METNQPVKMPNSDEKSTSRKPRHGNDLLNACCKLPFLFYFFNWVPERVSFLSYIIKFLIDFGNTAQVIKWIDKGADVHFVDPRDGWAGIHYAARWGKTRIIDALTKAGVDINLRTTGKETALHKACRSNRKETIVWMMQRGANAQLLNGTGEKASDLTVDAECKFVCDHFNEYLEKWKLERRTGGSKARIGGMDATFTNCEAAGNARGRSASPARSPHQKRGASASPRGRQ